MRIMRKTNAKTLKGRILRDIDKSKNRRPGSNEEKSKTPQKVYSRKTGRLSGKTQGTPYENLVEGKDSYRQKGGST